MPSSSTLQGNIEPLLRGRMSALVGVLDSLYFRRAAAIGCSIMFALILLYNANFPSPFMVVIPLLVIPFMFPHALQTHGKERIMGCLLGVVSSLLILNLVEGVILSSLLFLLSIFVAGLFIGARKLFYMFVMTIITFAVMFGITFQEMSLGIEFGVTWTLGTAIGVWILYLNEAVLWPKSFQQEVDASLSKLTEKMIASLDAMEDRGLYNLFDLHKVMTLNRLSKKSSIRSEMQLSLLEGISHPLRALIKAYENFPHAWVQSQKLDIRPSLKELREHLVSFLSKGIFRTKTSHLDAFESAIEKLRSRETVGYSFLPPIQVESLVGVCYQMRKIHQLVQARDQPRQEKAVTQTTPSLNKLLTKKNACCALRIALALLLTLYISVFSGLPVGVQSIITCVVMMVQPNDGRAGRQAFLRLLGIILGTVTSLGMMVTVSHMDHFLVFVLLYALAVSLFAFCGMRSPKNGYMFLQAGLVFVLLFSSSPQNISNFTLVEERFLGVFVGFFCASLVIYLWPLVDPWKGMREKMSQAFISLAQIIKKNTGVMSDVVELETDLKLLGEDVKFYRSKHGYKVQELEQAMIRLRAILHEGVALKDLSLPQAIQEHYEEACHALFLFFLQLAEDISKGDSIDTKDQALLLLERFEQVKMRLRKEKITLLLDFSQLQQLVAYRAAVDSILKIICNIKLTGDKPEGDPHEVHPQMVRYLT